MKPRVHGRGNNPARGKNVRVELIFFRLENVWVRYIFYGGIQITRIILSRLCKITLRIKTTTKTIQKCFDKLQNSSDDIFFALYLHTIYMRPPWDYSVHNSKIPLRSKGGG